MTVKEQASVTMRVRIGDNELEVNGPSDFVEKKVAEFLEQQKSLPLVGTPKSSPHHLEPAIKSTKDISIAQFFKRMTLQSHADRFLAAGYYLEKKENMEKFTAAELSERVRTGAKKPLPKNPNDVVNGNVKRGLMMSAGDKDGKIAFVLTSDGEEAIETLLKA